MGAGRAAKAAKIKLRKKVRENRARRAAERRGWLLVKCRRRDPQAVGFGLYAVLQGTTAEEFSANERGQLPGRSLFKLTLTDLEELLK